MRIGERLIRDEIITAVQLEAALRVQVLRGGRLGTNLVELGYVDIDTLAECLGRHHGMPAALGRHFELATPEIQARLPPDIAAAWGAVPMGRLHGSEAHVAVAVMEPLPEAAVHELSGMLGCPIVLAVAPELRLLYHLEQVYRIPRSNRFIRVRVDGTELPSIAEPTDDDAQCDIRIHIDGEDELEDAQAGARAAVRARTRSAQGAVPALRNPAAERSGAAGPPERRRFVQPLSETPRPEAPAQLARIAIKRVAPGQPAAGPSLEPELPATGGGLDDVLRAIRQATGRDRVGDLVVGGIRSLFGGILDAGIILVIREPIAIGWKGFVRGGRSELVEAVALPLSTPSVVYEPYRSGKPYIGAPQAESDGHAGTEIDRRLWTLLRTQPPATVAVVPVVLEGQTVCMLYGHSAVPPGEAAVVIGNELGELASATAKAFARLIRAAQR